jgi:hypothetical protein
MRHITAVVAVSFLAACAGTTVSLHRAVGDCQSHGGEGWAPIRGSAANAPSERADAISGSVPAAKDGRIVWFSHSDERLLYCRTDGCSGVTVQFLRASDGAWLASEPNEWLCVN